MAAAPDPPEDERARARLALPEDWWPWALLLLGLAFAGLVPLFTAEVWGADLTWPALVSGFSATFLAFVVALAWDRRQRRTEDLRETAAEARREEAEREAEHERRRLEARRRCAAIALELERIEESLRRTVEEQRRYKYFFPDLPTGSWRASGAPLGLLVANYALMADLSTFYGQVEELRWRLRFKAYPAVDEAGLIPLVDGLSRELLKDAQELLREVRKQVDDPDVEPVLSDSAGAQVVGRRQLTRAIRMVDLDLDPSRPPDRESAT